MRILHVFRTPVGGLFRHVRDLARGQAADGHAVGIVCDSRTGGEAAVAALQGIAPFCGLGIMRRPVSRLPGIGDIAGARAVAGVARELKPDILHGHGAKGGLYARLAGWRLGIPSVYTPHGGSLHFEWSKPGGAVFLLAEQQLRRIGSGLLFVCDFEKRRFDEKIGIGGKPWKVVHNGLWPEEIAAVTPAADAADVIYLGELRHLKGVDVLLRALALLNRDRPVTATITGGGEDRDRLEALGRELGLAGKLSFTGPLPARAAFARGRVLAMPSRNESFPYVILEAAAAGLPIVATDVGGIAEAISGPALVPPDDPARLAEALLPLIADAALRARRGGEMQELVRHRFAAARMCREITGFYREVEGRPMASRLLAARSGRP